MTGRFLNAFSGLMQRSFLQGKRDAASIWCLYCWKNKEEQKFFVTLVTDHLEVKCY